MKPYYEQSGVTIYHGDALDLLQGFEAQGFEAVVTDPPYVIGAVSAGNMASKAGGWADMMNSALWFAAWYEQVQRLLSERGSFWTFCNWRSLPVVMRAAMTAAMPITSLMVWDKEWIGPGGKQGLRPAYELVALSAKPEFAIRDRSIPDVWRCKVGSYKPHGHPAEKPQALVERILRTCEASRVLDPFMGSGTTLAAARALGIPAVGIEAEERYCEVAAKRLSATPDQLPEREVA